VKTCTRKIKGKETDRPVVVSQQSIEIENKRRPLSFFLLSLHALQKKMANPMPVPSKPINPVSPAEGFKKIRVLSERPPNGTAGEIYSKNFVKCCDGLHIRLDNIRITADAQTPVYANKAYLLSGDGPASTKCGGFGLYKDLHKEVYVVEIANTSMVLPNNFKHTLERRSMRPQTLEFKLNGRKEQLQIQLATPNATTFQISYEIPAHSFLPPHKPKKYFGVHVGGTVGILSHAQNCNLDMTFTQLELATLPHDSNDWHVGKFDFSDVRHTHVFSGLRTDWLASVFHHNGLKCSIVQPKHIAEKNKYGKDESMDDEFQDNDSGVADGGSSGHSFKRENVDVKVDCATTADKNKKKTWGSTYYAMLVVFLLVLIIGMVASVRRYAIKMEKRFNNIVGAGQARGGLVQGGVSSL
jgi:hypothetical protein